MDDVFEFAKKKVLPLIRETDECIEFPTLNHDGYGAFSTTRNGVKFRFLAHRVAYQLTHNNIQLSPNDCICHHCDNPRCINPKHLFLGTQADNMADKVAKGRQAKGNKNGRYIDGRASDRIVHRQRKHGNLEISQVMEVRELKKRGYKLSEIAKILNIPYQTVRDISCGRSYKSIK